VPAMFKTLKKTEVAACPSEVRERMLAASFKVTRTEEETLVTDKRRTEKKGPERETNTRGRRMITATIGVITLPVSKRR